MKLSRIALDQVRQFDRPVVVEGLKPGLNLLAGPNELGKSTLLEALRAALFTPHGSRKATSLQHFQHRTAPRVELELEVDDCIWHLEKRFLIGPRARLESGAGARFEGRAADEELARLLGGEPAPAAGLWNLLMVAQGEAIDPSVPGDARAVLQASLEAALGGEAGSHSAKALIVKLSNEERELVHGGHGGPIRQYREVIQKIEALDQRIEVLTLRREENRADLDALEQVLGERSRVATGGADEARQLEARLTAARAREHARHALFQAEAGREAAARAGEQRSRLIEGCREATARIEAAKSAQAEARQALQQAEAAGREVRARRDHLVERQRQLKELLADLEAWQRLERALAAEASEVAFTLLPEGRGQVRIDGEEPAAGRFSVRVRDHLTVEIAGVGRFEVRPATGRTAPLRDELDAVTARVGSGQKALGLQAEDEPASHLIEIEAELAQVEQRLLEAREQFGAAKQQLSEAEVTTRTLEAERARQAAELEAARRETPDPALDEALRSADTAVRAARDALERSPCESEADVAALEARLADLRNAEKLGAALERKALELRTRIETRSADGLSEQLGEFEAERRELIARRDSMAREVAVLRLLKSTLIDAEATVRERYLEPLIARLQPHLELVLPGARAALDDDLQVTLIQRGSRNERFASLSHGTREQIAIATRLAFAEVLAEQGQPAMVVLDDALAFSDDTRLARMFEVLERASRHVQILVLTCRERAFESLVANRVQLVEQAAADGEAAA